jgi:hypothetical protein
MAKVLFVRIAGGFGLASLALFFLGLIPFLSADPTAGAGLTKGPASRSPAFSVNRQFKGDRLPLIATQATERTSDHPKEIPVGCDASFSPISAPRLALVFGRCTT